MNPCKNCGARYVECGECGDDITTGIDHLVAALAEREKEFDGMKKCFMSAQDEVNRLKTKLYQLDNENIVNESLLKRRQEEVAYLKFEVALGRHFYIRGPKCKRCGKPTAEGAVCFFCGQDQGMEIHAAGRGEGGE
jgi:hypothetical protein